MSEKKLGGVFVVSSGRRIGLLALALSFLLSVTAFAATSSVYDVIIVDGDDVTVTSTYLADAQSVAEQAGIVLFEGDSLDSAEFNATSGSVITVNRGVKVTVVTLDRERISINMYGTVEEALAKAGVDMLYGYDTNYPLDETVFEDMVIRVLKKYNVTLKADSEQNTQVINGSTVRDALDAFGVVLGEDDVVLPQEDAPLTDDMEIVVSRVTYEEHTVTESIPFDTVYVEDDTRYVTETSVVTSGVKGEKTVTYRECYVDGEYAFTEVIEEIIHSEPQDKVIAKGTKAFSPSASGLTITATSAISEMAVPSYVEIGSDGLPVNYSGCIYAKATAYCEPGGLTSTGKRAQTGYIAVDPKEIPYGTEMYIVSADGKYVYGYCIAADTGGYIYSVDWTVDLYMNSESQCIQWGRRDIVIYFL